MKILNNISAIFASATLLTCVACADWTRPENMDFHHKTPEQENPQAYAAYLEGLRAYKQSEHNVMIVTMQGTADYPSSQSRHIMAMPDSADYVCVDMENGLHEIVASEISEVKTKKGTKVLLFIDYADIAAAWSTLEDERSDNGLAPGTDDELKAFYKEQTELQLANCNKYGFHGIMVSYIGNKVGSGAIAQEAFMGAVKEFHKSNPGKELLFRGSARNIIDMDFMEEFSYTILIAGEEKKLTTLIVRFLGSVAPSDRVIMELTVPSSDVPEQVGASLKEGAKWVLDEAHNTGFTPRGLCVSNGQDDYYCKDIAFGNIRAAITIMNPVNE
ncbi:MAG: glycoside hydrolase family 18 [Clostridium sp.]|nr:glycoside hydrolase family 18 [Bacteroides sp.]MCM1197299.1 glycoside hydrolase family 18 [Clostridium sp.]